MRPDELPELDELLPEDEPSELDDAGPGEPDDAPSSPSEPSLSPPLYDGAPGTFPTTIS
jgi:hypothetical protein